MSLRSGKQKTMKFNNKNFKKSVSKKFATQSPSLGTSLAVQRILEAPQPRPKDSRGSPQEAHKRLRAASLLSVWLLQDPLLSPKLILAMPRHPQKPFWKPGSPKCSILKHSEPQISPKTDHFNKIRHGCASPQCSPTTAHV